MLLVLLVALFAAAVAAPLLSRFGHKSGWLLALLPAAGAAVLIRALWLGIGPLYESFAWAPSLGIAFSLYYDGLSLLFGLMVLVLGALVAVYASGYLEEPLPLGRFYGWLFAFMGGMLGLVFSGNLITLYLFWEVTTVSSFFLIGFHQEDAAARENARQALLITTFGGLAMLAGFLLLGEAAGTYEIHELLTRGAQIKAHANYPAILVLICMGAFTKSAQVPFHFWLPNAMVAPTPVSAYLHSATMVKAGVFLLMRLQPILGDHPYWHYMLESAGALTMLTGSFIAVVQTDLKRILAYSTISVLGMLMLLTGIGTQPAIEAATVYLIVHSLYKGALFLVAGAIDHATGTRDVTRLGRLWRRMPVTSLAGALAALSMAGLPPMFGFISKELLYEAKLGAPDAALLITIFSVAANVFLVTVAVIVGFHPFWGKCPATYERAHETRKTMLIGPVTLALASLVLGLFPDSFSARLVSLAVSAVEAEKTTVSLKVWHGVNPIFLLSVFTVAAGIGMYFVRKPLRRISEAVGGFFRIHSPTAWYGNSVRGLMRVANRHTVIMQHGYLGRYVAVVAASAAGVVGVALWQPGTVQAPHAFAAPVLFDWAIALLLCGGAILVAIVRRRMAAVVGLSSIGLAVALLFGFYSGLDLAMVQFAVETLGIVLLVVVLLRLPSRYAGTVGHARRLVSLGVAVAAGAAMAAAMYAAGKQPDGALGRYFAEQSVAVGHGRNIVNVILVDFRALDTLGEAAVVAIAAVSVLALMRRERHP